MIPMRKTSFSSALFGLLCTLTALPAFGAEAAAPAVIRIGVTLGGHGDMHRAVFDTTREALAKHFGAERIDFRFMHTDVLSDKVNAGELDFFISTGGKSRRLMAQGSKDLLTMVTNRFPDPSRSYGGLFILNNSPLKREGFDQIKTLLACGCPQTGRHPDHETLFDAVLVRSRVLRSAAGIA